MNKRSINVPLGTIGLILILLKLTGVINWSWWYVTAPLWGGFLFFITMAGLFFLIALLFNNGNVKWTRKK